MATLPVLPVADVNAAIDHYVNVLGFTEEFRFPDDGAPVASAQVCRGDNRLMFNLNPDDAEKGAGGVWFWIRVDGEDIDAIYEKLSNETSLAVIEEVGDRFWGDRSFAVRDAFGYVLAFNAALSSF